MNYDGTYDYVKEIKKQLNISKFIDLYSSKENEIAFITQETRVKDINVSLKNLEDKGITVLSKIKIGDF